MDQPLVHGERREGGVVVLTLDHPKVNALSRALLGELRTQIDELRAQLDDAADRPGALVITGGPRIFAAGAEVSEFGGAAEAAAVAASFRAALDAVASFPRMTIAAINGYALGGGCELALACDLRVASSRARLGQPEILLGIIPGGGGTQRLARLVGSARAKDLICSGRQVGADEALAMGLVDRVVPPEDVLEEAVGWAAEFARGAVAAQALAKRAIDDGLATDLAAGLDLEAACFVEVFGTDDASIGVTSFLEQGPGNATFTGR